MSTRSLVPVLLLAGAFAYAQNQPTLQLDRFFLGQGDYAVRATLGEPVETVDDGDFTRLIYARGKDAFEVFSLLKDRGDVVFSIQLTGVAFPDMEPFQGLRLGSSVADLNAALGKPSSTQNLKFRMIYEKEQKDSQLIQYDGVNYSFIARDGKIISIKLNGLDGFSNETPQQHPLFWLVNAYQIPNYAMFMLCLMPNFEIVKAGKTIRIEEPFSVFVSNPNSGMFKQLVSAPDSLRHILLTYEFAEPGLRLVGKDMYLFMKGAEDNPVSEMLFTVWAGTFRLVKVTYR